MSLLPDDIDARLIRYFAGQFSEDERISFQAWLDDDPARGEEVERLRAVWEASAVVQGEPDVESALARLKQRAAERAGRPLEAEQPVLRLRPIMERPKSRRAYIWRIAAAVTVLLGGGLVWRSALHSPQSAVSAPPAPLRTYATARAERATLTLPDGSKVMLNNETTLEVPVSFGEGARDVHLRGEAYFEVARDPARPFRVHGGDAVTQVLGTKFAVRARSEEGTVQVAVAEGRVALARQGADTARRVVLVRGDLGRVAGDGSTSIERGIGVRGALGWTEGRLTFERTPLPEVLAELSRWFDRDFALGDSALAGRRLTTSLRGESLTEAIQVLETALELKARVAGGTVVLERVSR